MMLGSHLFVISDSVRYGDQSASITNHKHKFVFVIHKHKFVFVIHKHKFVFVIHKHKLRYGIAPLATSNPRA
jgi:hypothetical protein